MNKEKYIKRLITEWEQHGKVIIAVDFDDTISPWKFNTDEDRVFFDKVINTITIAKQTGAFVVVFTACDPSRHEDIRSYCMSKGLAIDSINETPVHSIPYGKNGAKIYANIFIDDRAGLIEALDILEKAMYTIRSRVNSNIDDVA